MCISLILFAKSSRSTFESHARTSHCVRDIEKCNWCIRIRFRYPHHVREAKRECHRGTRGILGADNVPDQVVGTRMPVVLATAESIAALEP